MDKTNTASEYNVETVSARSGGVRVVLAYMLMTRSKVGRKWSAWTKVRRAANKAEAVEWAARSGYIVRGAGR